MLDQRIAHAPVGIMTGDIKQTISHLHAKKASKDKLFGGREMLLEVYTYFATYRYTTILYTLSDIMRITRLGDSPKAAFRFLWDELMACVVFSF